MIVVGLTLGIRENKKLGLYFGAACSSQGPSPDLRPDADELAVTRLIGCEVAGIAGAPRPLYRQELREQNRK